MNTKYIIACSGSGNRWNNYLGKKKHLIEINGESLLHRTVRLIKSFDINSEIIIMAYTKDYIVKDTTLHIPILFPIKQHQNFPAIYASYDIWNSNGKTIFLFGDIFYTMDAMKLIINSSLKSNNIIFFGRKSGSTITDKKWQEIFGMSFNFTHNKILLEKLEYIKKLYERRKIKRFITWELYKFLNNIPINQIPITDFNEDFININDFTDDFDFPIDYDNWIKKYNQNAIKD